MKKLIFLIMFICILASCSKDTLVVVEPAKVTERVMIVDSIVLSKYPDFVVRYKVKRIASDTYTTITLTNEVYYNVYDFILYAF